MADIDAAGLNSYTSYICFDCSAFGRAVSVKADNNLIFSPAVLFDS